MINVSVEMVEKSCVVCGKKFKVLKGSKQGFCNSVCGSTLGPFGIPQAKKTGYITPGAGAPKKVSSDAARQNVKNIVKSIKVKNSESTSEHVLDASDYSTQSASVRTAGDIMRGTSGIATNSEKIGRAGIATVSVPTNEKTIGSEEANGLQKSTPAAITETPPESSGELSPRIEVAALDILTLSRRSAERLMRTMESLVSDNSLARKADGGGGPSMTEIEMAIKCGNAITGTVQANVNLLKALRG